MKGLKEVCKYIFVIILVITSCLMAFHSIYGWGWFLLAAVILFNDII